MEKEAEEEGSVENEDMDNRKEEGKDNKGVKSKGGGRRVPLRRPLNAFASQDVFFMDEDSEDEIVVSLGRPPSINFKDPITAVGRMKRKKEWFMEKVRRGQKKSQLKKSRGSESNVGTDSEGRPRAGSASLPPLDPDGKHYGTI